MKIKKTAIYFICLSLLVVLIYAFIRPVLDTQDDTFAEYMLGNGFSLAHFKVTYFEYGFLIYEKIFSRLYNSFNSVNWLSLFYILLHIISATIICNILLKKKRTVINIFTLAVYILLFFIPLITQLSYTTAAAHCMIATFFICLVWITENKTPSFRQLFLLFIFLTAAVSLRVHIIIPVIIVFIPFLLLIRNPLILKRLLIFLSASAISIVLLIMIHQKNYRENIPGWNNIQATSEAFYSLGNYGFDTTKVSHQPDTFKKAAFTAIENGYLYDDTLLSSSLLKKMQRDNKVDSFISSGTFSWLLTDIKQYFILLSTGLILLFYSNFSRRQQITVLLSYLLTVILSAYFLLYMKFPERIWLPVFLLLFLTTYFPFQQTDILRNSFSKKLLFVTAILLLGMQVVAIITITKKNKDGASAFISAYKIMNENQDILFIEYKESYPFNNFPALKLPSDYPINNVLFPFFLNTELRTNTFKKFGVTGIMNALNQSKKIVLIGEPDTALENYFCLFYGTHVFFKKLNDKNKSLQLYALSLKQ